MIFPIFVDKDQMQNFAESFIKSLISGFLCLALAGIVACFFAAKYTDFIISMGFVLWLFIMVGIPLAALLLLPFYDWIDKICLTKRIKALDKNIKTVEYPDNYYIIINNEYQIYHYVSDFDIIPYNKWLGNVLWKIDNSSDIPPKWVWEVAKEIRKFEMNAFACVNKPCN